MKLLIKSSVLLMALLPVSGMAHEAAEGDAAVSKQVMEERSAQQWVRLGNSLMQETRNTVSHDFTEAGAAFSKALALEPKNVEALLGMGWVANSNHDFKAGKQWCEKALKLNSKLVDAYCLMGDGAVELGAYDEAFQYFQQALDLRVDLSTYSRSAHLLWLTGDPMRARALMMKAVKSGGPHVENVAWCRAELSKMLLNEGALLPAKKEAEEAVLIARSNPKVLIALGNVRIAEKNFEGAAEMFERSLKVQPTHEAMEAMVMILKIQEKPLERQKMIDALIAYHLGNHSTKHSASGGHKHEQGDHHHHGEHGHRHADKGSSQLAKFLADEEIQLELALKQAELCYENFPNVYSADALGWCHFRAGNYKKAKLYSQRALKEGTPDAAFRYHAGMIAEKSGDLAGAKKELTKALSMNPYFDHVEVEVVREALKRIHAQQIAGREKK